MPRQLSKSGETPVDWRGTPLTSGLTVIYGAPVGRSIAMVEGVTDGFTPSGRVWIRIVRRAYGGGHVGQAERVHVGADRLTVVTLLPPTTVPTEQEEIIRKLEEGITRWAALRDEIESTGTCERGWSLEQVLRYHGDMVENLAKERAKLDGR